MRFCLLITLLVTACPAAETNPTAVISCYKLAKNVTRVMMNTP